MEEKQAGNDWSNILASEEKATITENNQRSDAHVPYRSWSKEMRQAEREALQLCFQLHFSARTPARPLLAAAQTGGTRERKLTPKKEALRRAQGGGGCIGNESQARFAPNGPFEVLRQSNQASTRPRMKKLIFHVTLGPMHGAALRRDKKRAANIIANSSERG